MVAPAGKYGLVAVVVLVDVVVVAADADAVDVVS